ncbi:peptidoglycan DD-metalloendopeptidase family protein [Fredinandcohnia sp. 179-A 10B2 NHS]|uniref:peptidoglycan DD-metalloendopeptidase family protein n=1 Tax=Fredinandcohnia sp. 179-A 10B2 NHS TaxID=3235176 RepID=UPI00399F1BB0
MREEEKKRTSQKSSLQRFFRKRWVFPAIYIVSAALILTAVLWFQGNNDVADEDFQYGEDMPGSATGDSPSVPVNQAGEKFRMPVIDEDAIEIFREFYDVEASAEKQEAALVFYDNTYTPNKGIDIVAKNGEAFEVVASLAGTVTRAEKDPLHGNVVEVEHSDGVVTMYQSLADLKVAQGDVVEQGDVLGMAGKNTFDPEAAIHVHFEIRNNGKAVNPLEFFGEPITSLEESEEGTKEEEAAKEEAPAKEEDATEDDKDQPAEEKPEDSDDAADEEDDAADDEKSDEEENANSTDASIGMAKA